jgi:hypothetical protein
MTLPLSVIANRIHKHLQRMEKDPAINTQYHPSMRAFDRPSARAIGVYIYISYVARLGASEINRKRAERYLEYLDQGGTGKHFELERCA